MIKLRVITGIVALIILFGAFSFGSLGFMRIFFTFLVGVTSWEIASMIFPKIHELFRSSPTDNFPRWIPPAASLLSCALFLICLILENSRFETLLIGLILAMLFGIFATNQPRLAFGFGGATLLCVVYSAFCWLAIWSLYRSAADSRYIYFLCAIVSSGDTVAYFVGKGFGKHKLAPNFSPNKTWEGAAGGMLGSFVGGTILKIVYGIQFLDWPLVILCCIVGSVLGQLGDLAESCIKRFSGVKDSGRIMPGHGGFLDRVDGLLIAAPGLWLILMWAGV